VAGNGLHVDATITRGPFTVSAKFDVAPRHVTALTGPSGDGATTVIRAIAGRLPIAMGAIIVDNVVVSAPGHVIPRPARRVGAVFEGYRLPVRSTIRDVVASAFRDRGVPIAVARLEAQPWLERFELDHLADGYPAGLAPMLRLRLALARTFAADPAVLVLDDPFAPIPESERRDGRRELAALLREFGRPVVVATRDPADHAALADDVAVRWRGCWVVERMKP
jgi:ABC-type sulfate/molybdate transport systems ATPase subunit